MLISRNIDAAVPKCSCALSLLRDRWRVYRGRRRAGPPGHPLPRSGRGAAGEGRRGCRAEARGSLAAVHRQVRARVLRWFARAGHLDAADARDKASWDHGRGFWLRPLRLTPAQPALACTETSLSLRFGSGRCATPTPAQANATACVELPGGVSYGWNSYRASSRLRLASFTSGGHTFASSWMTWQSRQ